MNSHYTVEFVGTPPLLLHVSMYMPVFQHSRRISCLDHETVPTTAEYLLTSALGT